MQEKTSTKQTQKMVKIKFNHPMRNINLTHDDYIKVQTQHMEELKAQYGTARTLPNETEVILSKINLTMGQPYIYLKGLIYEMPESDAQIYTAKFKEHIKDDKPYFFEGEEGEEMKKLLTVRSYFAEIVH